MHLALLGAVKRLILFWKEFHIDYLGYSDHKHFKQVGRNFWTASNRAKSAQKLRGFDEVKR